VANSSAEKMELKDGDLITKINNHPIIDWRDLSIAVSNLKPNDLIQVEFIRDNKRMISSGHIGKCEDKNKKDTDLGYDLEEPMETILSEEVPTDFAEDFGPYQAPDILIEEIQTNELTDNESNPIIDLSLVNDLKIEKLNLYTGTEQGIFYLSFLLPEVGNTSIKLYNDLGNLVYQYDLNDFGGTFRDEVDLSDTPRGIYFMEISQNKKSVNKKITLL
ncbi:MAG TPA: PDZ domain-containing protein, partial [Bacteroidetes bacterium]|nr:PDZ domain-containing protein [Bacteroidota bacterium]